MELINQVSNLKFFIKNYTNPILLELDIPVITDDAVKINYDITREELYGLDGSIPKWVKELEESDSKLLVIRDISKCPLEEQKKFIPLLKDFDYHDYKVLKDTIILVIDKDYNNDNVDKEVLSYLTQIKD